MKRVILIDKFNKNQDIFVKDMGIRVRSGKVYITANYTKKKGDGSIYLEDWPREITPSKVRYKEGFNEQKEKI